MKYYAVIDTNVLVSAMLKRDSVPGNIMELVFTGLIVPVMNERIVKEYREVLRRPKFHFTERIIHDVMENMETGGIFVEADEVDMTEIFPDKKDRIFYEIVMEERKSENAYLITGNIRHFPEKPFVVTPREMLDIILGEQ
ncbi:MAG: putative toxin-antitoxin system toxin component, PIN family [Bacteroidales bacterium]|nr:putative toxin-antitoxin system toxin component, PIN family [Bacteroidales bacterium]MCM1416411.1 putative toxin-antitoxin system toxin component, PIN family [bacterium]MCM1424058.1 putative toxin-antitoxin system toxin component, PIN family [bacterium]